MARLIHGLAGKTERFQVLLPEVMMVQVKDRAKKEGYSTCSDYMRNVLASHFKREEMEARIDSSLREQMRRIRLIDSGLRLIFSTMVAFLRFAMPPDKRPLIFQEIEREYLGAASEKFKDLNGN